MFYLDNLKELRVYSNIKLSSIKKRKNDRNSNLIFFSGNNQSEIFDFINSNIFSPSFFRGVYIPRAFNTIQKNKRIIVDQKKYYDEVKAKCSSIIYTKRALTNYNDLNLIYDITNEHLENEVEIKVRGRKRVEMYFDFLISKIKEGASYENKAVAIPVPDNVLDPSFFDLNNARTPFAYIYMAIKRKLLTEEQKKELKNVDFIFYTTVNNTFIKFNINDELSNLLANRFLNALNILIKTANHQKTNNDEKPLGKEDATQETENKRDALVKEKSERVKEKLLSNFQIDGNTKLSSSAIEVTDKIGDDIEKAIDSSDEDILDKSEDEIIDILNNSKELKADVSTLKELQSTGGDEIKQRKTLERLKEKQKQVTLDDINIQDIIDDFKSTSIDRKPITNTNVIQEETRYSNLKDFDMSYFEKQMKKDLVAVLSSFNGDSDVKLFVSDIKTEDTSTDLSKKLTYTVTFQDDRNVKHTVKFDYPIIRDGRFMNINGGKKLILKQILSLPIVKTKPDEVQITTNYNKFFVMRFGSKLSHKTEKLKKLFGMDLNEFKVSGKKFNYRLGNALTINEGYETTLEYNEISSFLLSLENDEYKLMFNQKEVEDLLKSDLDNMAKLAKINIDDKQFLPIGHTKDNENVIALKRSSKRVYLINNKKQENTDMSLSELIIKVVVTSLSEEAYKKLSSLSNSKSLAYNRVRINNRMIPLVVLLGYELGLEDLLERYNIEYSFDTKNKRITIDDDYDKIRFKDGYLYYNNSLLRNSLLLSGLSTMATEEYTFEEMNSKDPYIETFYEMFGSRNMGKGLHNTLSLMVDPITLDVLKQLELPENIYDILLYANTLLEDMSYSPLNDMSSYRIRGTEQVNAYLYKILADSFKTYKDTLKAGNPIKMSVPQDILLKTLMNSPTVDEYSVLNPSLEIEKGGAATYKGLSGRNLDDAYTTDIRAYDPSMRGIMAMSTPDSDKVNLYSHSY
ncbi:hypothetical protein Goe21_02060 [Bacillus phage vB_BsuM-Goe21]|nr:hypothetical protein Goe21_02060 [Bacillus phage vB_BsuM-Goe21]